MDEAKPGAPTPGKNSSASPDVPSSLPPGISPQPGGFRRVFFGDNGLRCGWRLLIFVVIAIALMAAIWFGVRPATHHLKAQIWRMLIGESISLFAVLVAAFIMSRIEGRRFGVYGLPKQRAFGKSFWFGVLWGIVSLTILLLILRGLGAFYFGTLAIHGERIAKFAAVYGLLFLIVGFFEEFFFRGYALFTLTEGIGFWPAAILLSIAFGAVHLGNKGEAWIGALSAGLIGFFFCFTLRRTGTLWFAVGLHAAWDWSESFLYSVPDSGLKMPGHLLNSSFQGSRWLTGGAIGPEGSVFVFVIIAAMWVLFHFLYPHAKYAVRAPASLNHPVAPAQAIQP